MVINNKPRAYILMNCQSHFDWGESNNIPQLLSEFDIEQETWQEFSDLIDIAAEMGCDCSKSEKYSVFPGDDAVTEILENFRASSDYKDALEVGLHDEGDDGTDELCDLAEESLVNSFYYALKGDKSD